MKLLLLVVAVFFSFVLEPVLADEAAAPIAVAPNAEAVVNPVAPVATETQGNRDLARKKKHKKKRKHRRRRHH